MKKIFCLIIFVSMFLCMAIFCSCKGNDEELDIKGLTDVEICVNDASFDFRKGVSGKDKNGNEISFSVENNNVDFSKSGEYEIKYIFNGVTKTRLVKIYGKPEIVSSNVVVSFSEINTSDYDFSSKIEAKDSFGEKVPVYMNQDFPRTNEGIIYAGEYEVNFKAVDKLNNESIKTLNVILENSAKYSQSEINIDYSNAYKTFLDVSDVINMICDGNICAADSYYYANNSLIIFPKLIKSLGLGVHNIYIQFYDGYISTKLNITNEEEYNVVYGESIEGNTYLQLDTIELPIAKKATSSIQDFEVKNYIQTPSMSDKTEIINGVYMLEESGEYIFYSDVISAGSVQREVVQHFTVNSILSVLKTNLIRKDIISKNIFSKQFVEDKVIEYYDQSNPQDVTTDAIVLNSYSIPKESDAQHYFGISEEYISKAKIMNCLKIKITLYAKCGFAIYDINAETSSANLLSYIGESDNITKRNITVDLANVDNYLAFDVFGKNANTEVIITEVKFLDENGEFTNINGNLVEEALLNYITGTNVTVTYEENVRLGGTLYNAIHIHGENTGSNGWTKSNFIDLQRLFLLKGTHTKVDVKAYGNCYMGFFDVNDGGKGPVDCNGKLGTRVLSIEDAVYISAENGGIVDLYITEIRFTD